MEKPSLLISKSDFELLETHLNRSGSNLSDYNKNKLAVELKSAKVFKDKDLPNDVASLYSTVEIKNKQSDQKFKFQLVLPAEANFKLQKVSVFAPIGIALLGYSVGAEIEWEMPDGIKKFEIMAVTPRIKE